jgi:transcriptional regulator with XRE-family HTH domain
VSKVLRSARTANGLTQEEGASMLDISRKTYLLLERRRWLPQPRARAHFARQLRGYHPPAADEFARILAASGAEDVEGAVETLADPATAKLVFDSALLALAERLDVPSKTLRPAVAGFLEALSSGGMAMGQVIAATSGKLR